MTKELLEVDRQKYIQVSRLISSDKKLYEYKKIKDEIQRYSIDKYGIDIDSTDNTQKFQFIDIAKILGIDMNYCRNGADYFIDRIPGDHELKGGLYERGTVTFHAGAILDDHVFKSLTFNLYLRDHTPVFVLHTRNPIHIRKIMIDFIIAKRDSYLLRHGGKIVKNDMICIPVRSNGASNTVFNCGIPWKEVETDFSTKIYVD